MNTTSRTLLAGLALAALAVPAFAQTPLPVSNGSFEDDDPIFGGMLGYNVLPGADVRELGDGGFPATVARTGNRSVLLNPPANNSFFGITTDAINIYLPSRPFYDPSINWLGGNIRVSVWYNIPASSTVNTGRFGIKLNVKLFNQDYATLEPAWDVGGTTNGEWVLHEVVWNKKDFKDQIYFLATEGCDGVGCFVANGPPPFGIPPYPNRVKVSPARWGGLSGGGPGDGFVFIDDLTVSQDPSCPSDFDGDAVVDSNDFVIFVNSYNNFLDFRCDLNGDGVTDNADFVLFVAEYNEFLCAGT